MSASSPVFADGFGRRVVRSSGAEPTFAEHLLLDPALAGHDGFRTALQDRAAQLQGKRLTSYARVHRVEVDGPSASVVSDYVPAWRLADVLDVAESENLTLDIGVVMLLLRQLLPTAALLSTQARDVASGALGPEHLLLTPQGRLVLTDYVFGSALVAVQWSPEELWRTLRVAVPADAGKAVSQRGDVVQVGITVLSLVAGRRLRDDEFPDRLGVLVESARQKTPSIVDAPLSPMLRDWLRGALQLGSKNFGTLFEAQMALERLLASDAALLAQPSELDQAVARFGRFMPPFHVPEPEPAPAPLEDLEPLMAPPPPDLVPLAVAFDTPQEPPPTRSKKSGVRKKAAAQAAAPPPAPEVEASELQSDPVALDAPVAFEEAAAVDEPPVTVAPPPPPPAPVVPAPVVEEAHLPAAVVAEAPPAPSPPSRVTEPDPEPEPYEPPLPVSDDVPWWRSARAVAGLAGVALVELAVIGWLASRPSEALGTDGELVVTSTPPGAAVVVDDRDHGATPVTIRMKPGTHVLQVRAGSDEPRVIPLTIRPGVQTAQYVELQGATTGVLEVRSEPSPAKVVIDGEDRGSTPLTLRDVKPGDYQVVLERPGWKSSQIVRIEPGTTSQLLVPTK
ncbi:MAG: PEGA domain-containing protein [Vicinamibacterales bacterium]